MAIPGGQNPPYSLLYSEVAETAVGSTIRPHGRMSKGVSPAEESICIICVCDVAM